VIMFISSVFSSFFPFLFYLVKLEGKGCYKLYEIPLPCLRNSFFLTVPSGWLGKGWVGGGWLVGCCLPLISLGR